MTLRIRFALVVAPMAMVAISVHASAFQSAHSGVPGVTKTTTEISTAQHDRQLALDYLSRQRSYEQKAQAEKREWERRKQHTCGPAAKYPRPVDSSKNRYEYFVYKAGQMGELAKHFENLAAIEQQHETR